MAPVFALCNQVEPRHHAVVDLDEPEQIGLVAAIAGFRFKVNFANQRTLLQYQLQLLDLVGTPARRLAAGVVHQMKASDPLLDVFGQLALGDGFNLIFAEPEMVAAQSVFSFLADGFVVAAQDFRGDVDDQTTVWRLELGQCGLPFDERHRSGGIELLQRCRQQLFHMGGVGSVGEGQKRAVRAEQVVALRSAVQVSASLFQDLAE